MLKFTAHEFFTFWNPCSQTLEKTSKSRFISTTRVGVQDISAQALGVASNAFALNSNGLGCRGLRIRGFRPEASEFARSRASDSRSRANGGFRSFR